MYRLSEFKPFYSLSKSSSSPKVKTEASAAIALNSLSVLGTLRAGTAPPPASLLGSVSTCICVEPVFPRDICSVS
jgi:hypothetical protein